MSCASPVSSGSPTAGAVQRASQTAASFSQPSMKGKKEVPGSVPASLASNWQCCRKFRAPGRPQSLRFSGQFNHSTAASGAFPSRHSPGPSHAAPRPHRGLCLHSSSPMPQHAGNKCKSQPNAKLRGLLLATQPTVASLYLEEAVRSHSKEIQLGRRSNFPPSEATSFPRDKTSQGFNTAPSHRPNLH